MCLIYGFDDWALEGEIVSQRKKRLRMKSKMVLVNNDTEETSTRVAAVKWREILDQIEDRNDNPRPTQNPVKKSFSRIGDRRSYCLYNPYALEYSPCLSLTSFGLNGWKHVAVIIVLLSQSFPRSTLQVRQIARIEPFNPRGNLAASMLTPQWSTAVHTHFQQWIQLLCHSISRLNTGHNPIIAQSSAERNGIGSLFVVIQTLCVRL